MQEGGGEADEEGLLGPGCLAMSAFTGPLAKLLAAIAHPGACGWIGLAAGDGQLAEEAGDKGGRTVSMGGLLQGLIGGLSLFHQRVLAKAEERGRWGEEVPFRRRCDELEGDAELVGGGLAVGRLVAKATAGRGGGAEGEQTACGRARLGSPAGEQGGILSSAEMEGGGGMAMEVLTEDAEADGLKLVDGVVEGTLPVCCGFRFGCMLRSALAGGEALERGGGEFAGVAPKALVAESVAQIVTAGLEREVDGVKFGLAGKEAGEGEGVRRDGYAGGRRAKGKEIAACAGAEQGQGACGGLPEGKGPLAQHAVRGLMSVACQGFRGQVGGAGIRRQTEGGGEGFGFIQKAGEGADLGGGGPEIERSGVCIDECDVAVRGFVDQGAGRESNGSKAVRGKRLPVERCDEIEAGFQRAETRMRCVLRLTGRCVTR